MTSNVTEFYKQSCQVLFAKSTGLVSKVREYCLQLPRVLQALLASRACVSREPCKHRSLQFLHLLAHLADGGRHHLRLFRQHDLSNQSIPIYN